MLSGKTLSLADPQWNTYPFLLLRSFRGSADGHVLWAVKLDIISPQRIRRAQNSSQNRVTLPIPSAMLTTPRSAHTPIRPATKRLSGSPEFLSSLKLLLVYETLWMQKIYLFFLG